MPSLGLRKPTIEVKTFSKQVSECVNTLTTDLGSHSFVDLERVSDQCVSIIYEQMDKVTTDTAYRAPPLVLMRFARGGKTVTLSSLPTTSKSH
eukprot:gene7425-8214_t